MLIPNFTVPRPRRIGTRRYAKIQVVSRAAPPHAGAALGLDRFCALLLGLDNLREVVAFPKTTKASCLLTHAPANVEHAQLDALGIQLREEVEEESAG